MKSYEILFHPEAKKEFDKLDGSVRTVVLKQLGKLRRDPSLGEKLGNRGGFDLTGYRKVYAFRKKIRIVYRIHEGRLLVFIMAVGKREDLQVYKDAFLRIKDPEQA